MLAKKGCPPESVFDFVEGITAVARSNAHQGARLAMDVNAKVQLEGVV
jgi:hypothetical protein